VLADIVTLGPMMDVVLRPTQALIDVLQAAGQNLPVPVQAVAMVDTGATGTVITPTIAQKLGLQPVGVVQMGTPSTTQAITANQYNIDMILPQGVTLASVMAIEAPLGGQHIQCLIGRDVLRHGVLIYIGYANQFTLSF
jgi:hypothetical protein